MEYTPRYSQPFTLEEAINFDVPLIIQEISRLENSLKRLYETQEVLKSYLLEPREVPDVEISRAVEENKGVIGSQEERISILKMALTEKGVLSSSHYETTQPSVSHGVEGPTSSGSSHPANDENPSSNDGVYL